MNKNHTRDVTNKARTNEERTNSEAKNMERHTPDADRSLGGRIGPLENRKL